MAIRKSICAGIALLALVGCGESKTGETPEPKPVETAKPSNKIEELKAKVAEADRVHFRCQLNSSEIYYFSGIVPGPDGATNESMADAFLKNIKSRSRSEFPVPAGSAVECESGKDTHPMLMNLLAARKKAIAESVPFRNLDDWKP